MEKIKIVFDVDGVFLNYGQSLQKFLIDYYGLVPTLDYSPKQWFMKGRFDPEIIDNLGFKNIEKEFEKAGLFQSIEQMQEIEFAQKIFESTIFEVYFVTSISEHLHNSRLKNLQTLIHKNITSQQLICVTPPQSKKPVIDKIKPHFFVEDSLNNLAECYGTHHSIWINLNERKNAYDLNHLNNFKIHEISNFNQIEHIFSKLNIYLNKDLISDIENKNSKLKF